MNFLGKAILCCLIVYNEVIFLILSIHTNLTALSDGPYILKLYQDIRNEDPKTVQHFSQSSSLTSEQPQTELSHQVSAPKDSNPRYLRLSLVSCKFSDVPSESDSVVSNTQALRQFCEDITLSGFFNLHSVPKFEIVTILNEIYDFMDAQSNPFRIKQFHRVNNFPPFKEHVFVCPLIDLYDNHSPAVTHYISKEYNVGSITGLYKPGRFIIRSMSPEYTNQLETMILAENPAAVHTDPDFNIELFYLQMRKFMQPAKRNDIDPLCKSISGNISDPGNQHYRICVIVARSSDLKETIMYPGNIPNSCSSIKISFRTPPAMRGAGRTVFYEQMTLCNSRTYTNGEYDREQDFLYISRAYLSNAIFVYYRDSTDGNIYLKNLSTNVGIVDELNSFDFIEN